MPATTDALETLAAATAGLFGDEFVRRLVRALADELDADVAFVAEPDADAPERLRVCAYSRADEQQWDVVAASLADALRTNDLERLVSVPVVAFDGSVVGDVGVVDASGTGLREVLQALASRVALELERRRSERELRAAAEEQAALRRVATLIAKGTPPEQLFDAVTAEVGRLFGAQTANLSRYEGDHIRIVGAWAAAGADSLRHGELLPVDAEGTMTAAIRDTGRPARRDSYDGVSGELATRIREIGIRSSIGAPVVVEGSLWGNVSVSKTTDEEFPPGAEVQLHEFAQLAAQAIANAETRDELAASRARLVEAAVEERQRLERNLHDGAQQRLVTLALSLRLIEARVDGAAAELLREASAELARALEELRELAHGIHPAVLTQRGLVPAVQGIVARAPLPVRLEAGVHVRQGAAVEAAAYYVVAEALTNVAKYSGAEEATVRLAENDGLLWVEVEDDGVGGADAAHGTGLAGLADRVEALGGRLQVRSRAGEGTLVRAEIPSRRFSD